MHRPFIGALLVVLSLVTVIHAQRPNSAAGGWTPPDRKSTRLNSSHSQISYAVFCLKKKKNKTPSHSAGKIVVENGSVPVSKDRVSFCICTFFAGQAFLGYSLTHPITSPICLSMLRF